MNDRPGWRVDSKAETRESGSPHIMWLMGQFFMIPVAAMVYSFELLLRTMQVMQKATGLGFEAVVGGGAASMPVTLPGAIEPEPDLPQAAEGDGADRVLNAAVIQKEEKTLSNEGGVIALDKDLHDDMLKLVRYKILFVKREYEHAFPEQEDLVSDNMDGAAFAAWKVAEFIQRLADAKTDLPAKWGKKYPSENRDTYVKSVDEHGARVDKLIAFPDHDKKYLRVYYEVLDRYPREKFKYEEQQIEVLKEIRNEVSKIAK